MKNQINTTLPWFFKVFYDKETNSYIINKIKWWELYKLLCYKLVINWLINNTYPFNFTNIISSKEDNNHELEWKLASKADFATIRKYKINK